MSANTNSTPVEKSVARSRKTLPIRLSSIKIRYRLPLLIGLVLFSVIVISSWASYEGVKRSALDVGNERLTRVTDELTNWLQLSIVNLTTKTLTAADHPDVRGYLESPSQTTAEKATQVISQFTPPTDQNSVTVELLARDGSVKLSIPSGPPLTKDLLIELDKADGPPFKTVGSIRSVNGAVVFPIVAAVRDQSGKPIGYLVRWRKLASTPEGKRQLTELVGSQASLYLGNNHNDVWTDTTSLVEKPPAVVTTTPNANQYNRGGKSILAASRPISGTPWIVVTEFSYDSIISAATRFFRRMILVGLILSLIGVAATFWMSNSITQPLNALTKAAASLSHGDYSTKVDASRTDELGDLGHAFNKMVAELRTLHNDLEEKVRQRTAELETANRQLQILSNSNAVKRTEAEREKIQAIDALRNTEEQLQQAQKLEAVGRLAGGIAHDFNNLLTAIIGYSDLSIARMHDGEPLKRNIVEIKKASERAASLTGQLLAFSRKQVLQPKVLDLNSVVLDLQKMLTRLIGEDIELRTSLAPNLAQIKADPTQLEQVIMNLAVNARDAMPTGGKVTIETANVVLDEAYSQQHIAVVPGAYVMIAVSDNGVGMDAETQRQMFEPFFTTKSSGKGTGLGLSMVYGIVKQSGGNIWVYSEPEHGTTFKIYLPAIEGEATAVEVEVEPTQQPATETVLLVEDEEVVRSLVLEVLKSEGYQVVTAASGSEALDVCSTHKGPIHLLITDVVMPGMSGKQLVTQLVGRCRDVKVLYMSGYTDDAIVNHGVLEPGVAFLQKPFTPGVVLSKVREVLNSPN